MVIAILLQYPLWIIGTLLSLLFARFYFAGKSKKTIPVGKYPNIDNKKKDYYDVAIVGSGPSGATAAYYLRKGGAKVLVLEKKKFPRDKYCGDAVCKTAIEILMEMGVYEQLEKENKLHVADCGGLISPGGLSYIGRSKEVLGAIPAAIAVKRIHLDEAIAMKAREVGADLREEHSVSGVEFDDKTGFWTISVEGRNEKFQSRVLVCADGANSKLGIELGIVKDQPQGICSRAFIKPPHSFKADGVVIYNKDLLPGYAAIFKHPNEELNYCCYLIPGNPKVTNDDQKYWHDKLLAEDPFIVKALGKNPDIETMKAAYLRLGGIPVSTRKHLLLVGDAAGMIDPLTGEGIHHAMEGGKIAGQFLLEAIEKGNFDASVMQIYHDRWMAAFGFDFKWSMNICQFLYRFPILIDAATAAVARKGDKFLARWADIMTGRVPKIHLLRPEFVIVITFELMGLLVKKALGRYPANQKKTVIVSTSTDKGKKKK